MLKVLRGAFIIGGVTYAALAISQPSPPPPDPAFTGAVQAQRNMFLDWHAAAESQIARLNAELAALKARIAELEKAKPKE